MAKGRDKHQAYLDALNGFGKQLARRAGRKCELSGASGSLVIYDLIGPTKSPELTHILLVSEPLKQSLEGANLVGAELRFLENSVWSTEPAIRRASGKLLSRINEDWARSAIENAEMMGGTPTG